MHWITSAVLGFVEGATEFIPVSSSGHLIIVRQLFGIQTDTGLSFDAVIQLATILAVIIYFRKDLALLLRAAFRAATGKSIETATRTMLYGIVLGSIPAAILGLIFERQLDTVFRSVDLVAWALIGGSILFWLAEKFAKQNKFLTVKNAVVTGFFQCLALIPGVSRSGATISGGLLQGLTREEATRFSFLLSVPILVASGLKKAFGLWHTGVLSTLGPDLILASIIAFVTGYFSIRFLITYLKNHTLRVFVIYRVALATAVLIFLK